MANLEIQENNSRPDRVGAATYANIAANSWNANDMRNLSNNAQPVNDITALFGNLDLFGGTGSESILMAANLIPTTCTACSIILSQAMT